MPRGPKKRKKKKKKRKRKYVTVYLNFVFNTIITKNLTLILYCIVRSAPEPIDEKKEISQNLLKTPIRSDYFTLEIIEKDRSFNYLK